VVQSLLHLMWLQRLDCLLILRNRSSFDRVCGTMAIVSTPLGLFLAYECGLLSFTKLGSDNLLC
jgi:hypothetical protein